MNAETENIAGTANPRAIAALAGMLKFRRDKPGQPATEIREDGSVIWRLQRGITVEMWVEGDRFARWHLDIDEPVAAQQTGDHR